MIRTIAVATLFAFAAPAAAATIVTADFGGATGNAASFTTTTGGVTLTATSQKFFVAPGLLSDLAQTTTAGQLRRTAPGIGTVGGGSGDQLDTNTPGTAIAPLREAILITGSEDFSLRGLKLSFVDADDTLKVFGVRGTGELVDLGYGNTATVAGTIRGGLNGAAIGLVNENALNSGTSTFAVAPTAYFTRYLFTTRVGGDISFLGTAGQGYRLDSITAAVPEASTWTMLIVGFGLIGVAARRRATTTSVAA